MFGSFALPYGLALLGAILAPLCSLFVYVRPGVGFEGTFFTVVMSAAIAAALFYYVGSQLLKTFGLPRDTTMSEFHRFMLSGEN